jgi:hypothetical protein
MNFKEATDRLFDQVDHENLAQMLKISVASIRQARLAPGTLAHRPPPKHWQRAVLQLAEERVAHYQHLIEELVQATDDREPSDRRQLAGRPITEMRHERKGG